MGNTVKTAVSLSSDDFALIEKICKTEHKNRSRVISDALHAWIDLRRKNMLEEKHLEGYRRTPERPAENQALHDAGLTSWDKNDW